MMVRHNSESLNPSDVCEEARFALRFDLHLLVRRQEIVPYKLSRGVCSQAVL
jgi:hypothetical protein